MVRDVTLTDRKSTIFSFGTKHWLVTSQRDVEKQRTRGNNINPRCIPGRKTPFIHTRILPKTPDEEKITGKFSVLRLNILTPSSDILTEQTEALHFPE